MTEPTRCPSCGEKMPANAIHGPCPACLLRQGAAASYSARFPTTQWNQVIAAGGRDAPKARAAFAGAVWGLLVSDLRSDSPARPFPRRSP